MKRAWRYIVLLVLLPVMIVAGALVFSERAYAFVTLCGAVLVCLPFFWRFERRAVPAAELVMVAVLIAFAVVGRSLFAFLPHVKPVAALVILAGMYLGGEDGFMVGAMTAILSNFYFGQGMWTPFQMLAWGAVGLLAGVLSKPLKKHLWLLALYGVFAGLLFSAIMDVWTVLWHAEGFSFARYVAAMAASLPATVTYIVSNVVFLLLLSIPIGRVLTRALVNYGLADQE